MRRLATPFRPARFLQSVRHSCAVGNVPGGLRWRGRLRPSHTQRRHHVRLLREAPVAATDGPFASSVEGGWGLLWVFPATLAELATDAGSNSTLLGSLGIQTNLSEPRPDGLSLH